MLMGPYGITLEKDWNLFFDRAAALRRIQSIHWSFGGFYTSEFCKYTAHTASLDFAPFFVRAQLRQSHTLHKCISPLSWFGHTQYIGASNITTLVNIVDQTVAAKADMFQEDSYQIEIDSDDHL